MLWNSSNKCFLKNYPRLIFFSSVAKICVFEPFWKFCIFAFWRTFLISNEYSWDHFPRFFLLRCLHWPYINTFHSVVSLHIFMQCWHPLRVFKQQSHPPGDNWTLWCAVKSAVAFLVYGHSSESATVWLRIFSAPPIAFTIISFFRYKWLSWFGWFFLLQNACRCCGFAFPLNLVDRCAHISRNFIMFDFLAHFLRRVQSSSTILPHNHWYLSSPWHQCRQGTQTLPCRSPPRRSQTPFAPPN